MSASTARAATDAEQAEALIREGVKLRASDNAVRALPLFEQAYQLSRTPRTAAQLGLCELELGYFVATERYLTEALAAPDHPWVSKNKASLKKALDKARANIGELSLIVAPPTAEVYLNHKPVDKALLAAPIRLDKGPVDIDVRASGYESARDTVIMVGGKRESRTYALARDAKVAEPAPPVPAVVPPPPPPEPVAPVAAPAPSEHKHARIAAFVTGGAAVGALAIGTLEAFSAASKRDTFNNHTSNVGGVVVHDCGTSNLSQACKSLKTDYDQSMTLSIVGFAVAGALAATSTVLFVLSSSSGGERAGGARALTCVPDPVGRGIGCSLRF